MYLNTVLKQNFLRKLFSMLQRKAHFGSDYQLLEESQTLTGGCPADGSRMTAELSNAHP
jgi:hypothetical protein